MRPAHPLERAVGVDRYVSDADGVGGRLRVTPEDFRVTELETVEPKPLDADPGAYAHLVLRATLRGWDTNDFAARLSDALGTSRERVSWAGTKDKRAGTTQLFSVRGVSGAPPEIPEIPAADVEVVGRYGRALAFGDLAGNAFAVRVRDHDALGPLDSITSDLAAFGGEPALALPDAVRTEADGEAHPGDGASGGSDAPTTVGIPNFFGHQRFGSIRPVTHEVGLRAVRGDWRGAVLAYAGNPHEGEPERTREARAVVDEEAERANPDWAAALDRMPGHLGYERSMLHRLDERRADDDSGDDDWRYALEAVPSNLQRLFVNAAQSYAFNRILSERLARDLPFDRPVEGDVVCFADRDAPDGLSRPDAARTQRVTERRVSVVERHCARGRAFVTAPLVGRETEPGGGEPGEIERAVLDDLDLAPADFDLPGAFDSAGTRRAVLVRTALAVDRDPLTFRFALPSGSYATVLLREFTKASPRDL